MRRWGATAAVVLAGEFALLTLLAERPETLLALAALAAAFAWSAPARRHGWALPALLLLGTWTMLLTQGLFYAGEPRTAVVRLLAPAGFPWGEPPGLYLYREGLLHGLVQSLRVDAMLLLGAGLLRRYAGDELTRALTALRMPPALGVLFTMALRFVPVLAQELRVAHRARRLRTGRLGWPGPPWAGGAGWAGPLQPVLAANLRRADEIAAALRSRGFSFAGLLPEPVSPLRPVERVACWAGAAVLAAWAALATLAGLSRAGFPLDSRLEALIQWVSRHG
jgi:energy-coupling factor transporter transmembrane protein EcfT